MRDYLLMSLMAVLWAGAFVSGKLSVAAVKPEMVAFLRFLVGGGTLLIIMVIWQRKDLRLPRKDWLLVAGLGATGIAAYNLLFFRGLNFSRASDGAMIIPTLNPLITLFAAAILLGEPLSRRKLGGAAIALVGQVLIFWTLFADAAHDPTRLLGDLYYVGAAVCWSAYTILGRIAAKRLTPMAATTWGSLSGMVMLIPFALWQAPASTGYTSSFWGNILYLGLGATVAGFFLWSLGLQRLGASRAAVFINLVPVCTLILAYLVLEEQPSWLQVIGMGVVLAGVYLAGTATTKGQPVTVVGESA